MFNTRMFDAHTFPVSRDPTRDHPFTLTLFRGGNPKLFISYRMIGGELERSVFLLAGQ